MRRARPPAGFPVLAGAFLPMLYKNMRAHTFAVCNRRQSVTQLIGELSHRQLTGGRVSPLFGGMDMHLPVGYPTRVGISYCLSIAKCAPPPDGCATQYGHFLQDARRRFLSPQSDGMHIRDQFAAQQGAWGIPPRPSDRKVRTELRNYVNTPAHCLSNCIGSPQHHYIGKCGP